MSQTFRVTIAFWLAAFTWNIWTLSALAQSHDLTCFMITSSGEVVDLGRICEREYVDLSAIRLRATERLNNGDLQGAIDDFTQLLRVQPNDAETHFTRGLIYWDIDDRQNAIADFQRSAQLFRQQGDENRYLIAMEQIEQIRSQP
jgi:tetratricopeptide (TPR) repeat protein